MDERVKRAQQRVRKVDKLIGEALEAAVSRRGYRAASSQSVIDAFMAHLGDAGVDLEALDAVLAGDSVLVP